MTLKEFIQQIKSMGVSETDQIKLVYPTDSYSFHADPMHLHEVGREVKTGIVTLTFNYGELEEKG